MHGGLCLLTNTASALCARPFLAALCHSSYIESLPFIWAWHIRRTAAKITLSLQGHAFEARVYAESPSKGFMPSPGSIASWRVPPGSVAFTHHGDVRVDSGVQQGDQVLIQPSQSSCHQFCAACARCAGFSSVAAFSITSQQQTQRSRVRGDFLPVWCMPGVYQR